ncbi:hypothetical protein MMC13_008184 [Lambiella insularis]|nr:hypothetical protein [Lambiella insularis]
MADLRYSSNGQSLCESLRLMIWYSRSFHEKTKSAKPNQPCKPTTYWAGVLDAGLRPEGPKTESDYLWVKCHQKVTADLIAEQYKARHPDQDVVLWHNGKIVTDHLMKTLDIYNDHIIAFEAIRKSDLESRALLLTARQPLSPSTHQVTQKKVKTPEAASLPSSKQPSTSSPYPAAKIPAQLRSPSKAKPSWKTAMSPYDENLGAPGVSSPRSFNQPSFRTNDHGTSSTYASPSMANGTTRSVESPLMAPDASTLGFQYLAHAGPSDAMDLTDMVKLEHQKQEPDLVDVKSEMDFKKQFDESASQDEVPQSTFFQLQQVVADASLEVLERTVQKGVEFLNDLKAPLLEKVDSSPDAGQWAQQIEKLQSQVIKAKTVIGVVGNTGAGKSSVINAMLDEERLVPTNTMRACTAVVTELSYNHENDGYRAEIEFITVTDWEKELEILFQDLLDDDGKVSRDCTNEDCDAGVAYAKIKAVYPKKTKEDISNSNVQQMLRDVSHVLGTTRKIKEQDALKFYIHLRRFVDSKEKATGKKDKEKKSEPKEMEFWPLIKVVRIFVRSPALETGAVIVDLPGVHDANAARAAVAESYMKQCTGLWIVAPIIRAVDDKAAKNLLGESFKRQLKMDGGFNSVKFICSKTDDISLTEASDSVGLDDQNGPAWEEKDRCAKTQKDLNKKLEDLKENKAAFGEAMQDVDEELETWECLRDTMEDEKPVYAPSKDKKRKKKRNQGSKKKQRRSSDDEDDDDFIDDDVSAGENEDEEEAASQGTPLTEEHITSKMHELRATKKEASRQRTELDDHMKALRAEVDEAKKAENKIESQISKVCIEGRNAYSKGAIQQDFAAGMKELDQEIAAEDDEENFNPAQDVRDYDEVARSLPVFCVSSRGYQKLQGRLKKDPPVPGFQTLEETEIPQLQAHCKQLTVAGRTAICKRFMTNLSQLLNSMNLWASNDGSGENLSADQKANEARFLQKSLENLESGLEKIVLAAVKDFKGELNENVHEKYETAISYGMVQSTQTTFDWGRPVNRADRPAGGYYYATYRAITRRNGVFSNAQGPHDWNQTLSDPMLKVLSSGWERIFTRRSPTVLATMTKNASNLLKAFHHDIDSRARKNGASVAGLHMLSQQLQVYEDIVKDLAATTKDFVSNQQKEINREFVPAIGRAMAAGYDACNNETGPGCYARMKAAMYAHVDEQRHTMFSNSTNEVWQKLKALMLEVEEILANKADEVFVAMRRDYTSVLGGDDLPQGELMPKWQRAMRRDVRNVINSAEKTFKKIAGIGVTEKDEAAPPAIIDYGANIKMEVKDEDFHRGDTSPGRGRSATPTEYQSGGAATDIHRKLPVTRSQERTPSPFDDPDQASDSSGKESDVPSNSSSDDDAESVGSFDDGEASAGSSYDDE